MATYSMIISAHHFEETHSTSLHAHVTKLDYNVGDSESELMYRRDAELVWDEGQEISARAFVLKALTRFVEASRLDPPF